MESAGSGGLETRRFNGTKSAFADCGRGLGAPIEHLPMPGPNARSHSEIYLHLVWGTWDRHPLLTPDRIALVYGAIERGCKALGCEVIAIGGTEDHVHLVVSAPPTVAPATLAKQVKGSSSHLVNSAHGTRAEFRWQRGYAVLSVSRQHVQRIRRYVLNQEEHHRTGRIAEFLEPVYPPLVPPP